MPWANGLGITADVCLSPPDTADWTWRLSVADVSDDVAFSSMPGIDRHILVAQGAGIALVIDRAPEVRIDQPFGPFAFDGDDETVCRLLDGPVQALNLMLRRGRGLGSLRSVRLRPGGSFASEDDDVAVVVLDGTLHADAMLDDDATLTSFDAALLGHGERVTFAAHDSAWCAVASVRLLT